jgi:hypothetical protein
MMLPHTVFTSVLFISTVLLTLWMLYKASKSSLPVLIISICWLAIQGVVGLTGFYTVTHTLPPRLICLIGPPLLLILLLILTSKGRNFMYRLDAKKLTYLHTIRFPVELVLFLLYTDGFVPGIMTFEGRNFDIITGITAPLVAYWGYTRKKISRPALIGWNLVGLGLLFNIVIHAILAAPTSFQQFAFTQPNVGILYFPFIWLPSFVVPVVLLSHISSLLQLIRNKT